MCRKSLPAAGRRAQPTTVYGIEIVLTQTWRIAARDHGVDDVQAVLAGALTIYLGACLVLRALVLSVSGDPV